MRQYEMVVGLEVHVELDTKSKIFCDCPTGFGGEPNSRCCPVCTGMPGALPVLNRRVVEQAIKAGLATGCTIAKESRQDRKNYFYPDLPKAYQISQLDAPLCTNGHLDLSTDAGVKRVGITRIHIEEDAGKLVHDPARGTLLDCNRCGVPLIEIVSEPDIRSAREAVGYLKKLQAVLMETGVSGCKMNEGAFRCDVNLSVREQGSVKLGTRTELKNLNSFQFVEKAIESEFSRQVAAVEKGEIIVQETRRFDEKTGKTLSMRSKENADDYRYFPDPDLIPISITEKQLEEIRSSLPELSGEKESRWQKLYGISPILSGQLTGSKVVSDCFETAAKETAYPAELGKLLLEGARLFPEENFLPTPFVALSTLLGAGKITGSTAKALLPELLREGFDPETAVIERGLQLLEDQVLLEQEAEQVLLKNPQTVTDYWAGKEKALQPLLGQLLRSLKGRADPVTARTVLLKCLSK